MEVDCSNEVHFFGRTLKVIKRTNRGLVLLFRDQKEQETQNINSGSVDLTEFAHLGGDIPDTLRCGICMELYTEPLTFECGHTFCCLCITQWSETGNTCPACRKTLRGGKNTTYAISDMVARYKSAELAAPAPENNCIVTNTISLFESQDEADLTSNKRERDGDEQANDAAPEAKKPRKKKGSDTTIVYKEYYLCGELCEEITSPLNLYGLRGEALNSGLYKITEIKGFEKDYKKLTMSAMRKCILESEYFGKGNRKYMLKVVNEALQPLTNTHGFSLNAEITDGRYVACLTSGQSKGAMDYILRNTFVDGDHYNLIRSYGSAVIQSLSAPEIDLLDRVIADDDPRKEAKVLTKKLELFEKMCFTASITKEQKNAFIDESFEGDFEDSAVDEIESVWNASILYHELLNVKQRFGNSCLIIDKFDENYRPDSVALLRKKSDIVEVWRAESDHNILYLITKDTAQCQRQIVSELAKVGTLTVVRSEVDDDHESADGYFDWIRTTLRGHKNVLVITSLQKRKLYLRNHTKFSTVSYDEVLSMKTSGTYSTILIDRCHVLGLEEFAKLLGRVSPENLYLCGSLLAMPETYGNPFADIYGVSHLNKIRAAELYSSVNKEKIAQYYPTVWQMINERKASGSMYIFVKSKAEKDKLLSQQSTNLTPDIVKSYEETKYSLPSRPTTCILLKGSTINRSQLAKFISCSSNKPGSVVAIGNEDDWKKTHKAKYYPRKSVLGRWIISGF